MSCARQAQHELGMASTTSVTRMIVSTATAAETAIRPSGTPISHGDRDHGERDGSDAGTRMTCEKMSGRDCGPKRKSRWRFQAAGEMRGGRVPGEGASSGPRIAISSTTSTSKPQHRRQVRAPAEYLAHIWLSDP